ncbi:MAG: helix-turn-helix domain-containing protein [Clostridiales bacterium]|nr:helix-turn-helix domain-containing protein [Clostridiales bacterium]
MSFERNLKALRLNRFLTQGAVASALYLSKSTYSQYERGTRRPDVDMIYTLADFFEVRIETLFTSAGTTFKTDTNFCIVMNRMQKELIADFEALSEMGKGRLMERAKALLEEEESRLFTEHALPHE